MRFDVAIVGAPFLDLTFGGLPHLPVPGEEVVADGLHITPGGTGMQAVAAARLGFRTALVSPVGIDAPGRMLSELLDREGVAWLGPSVEHTSVTAILPAGGAPAMVTFDASSEVSSNDVASVAADAVVLSLGRLALSPPEATRYVVTGPGEIDRFGPDALESLRGTRAVVVNEREAAALTGATDHVAAARVLAEHTATAVVTRGARGATGAEGTDIAQVPAAAVDAVNATGAGDVFVAAYLWADRGRLDLEARLRWSTLYASLSTTASTAFHGAPRLDAFRVEGSAAGLTPPEDRA